MEKGFLFQAAPFAQCHAATIAETSRGLAAAWFGGTREGAVDVGIWFSRRTAQGWTAPQEVAAGFEAGSRYPCWNPVLYQDPAGLLLLFYKVGPAPSAWWGRMLASADGGLSWTESRRLPDGILGPVKNKPVRLADGSLLCPSSREQDGWTVHVEFTPDLGETWEWVGTTSQLQVIQPAVLQHRSGRLQLLCRSKSGRIAACWSEDAGRSWSDMEETVLPNPNSGIDALSLADGRQLLVYNHSGISPGRWGGPRTPLNIAISSDGRAWQPGPVLEDTPGEYSYPALIQAADGQVHIVYTWRRENICHVVLDPSELET